MPYKHANGCTCMTMTEFLNEEGKREGKTGMEVWNDIVSDMDADDRKQEQYYKDNPKVLLAELKMWVDENEPDPKPVKVLEVLKVTITSKLRSNTSLMFLKVKFDDKKTRIVRYATSHWSGSFYDPPEDDSDIVWDWKGEMK